MEVTQQDLFASPEYHLVQASAGKRFELISSFFTLWFFLQQLR